MSSRLSHSNPLVIVNGCSIVLRCLCASRLAISRSVKTSITRSSTPSMDRFSLAMAIKMDVTLFVTE